MLKGILTVGGWTLASRVFGFARDMLIAAFLGAGPVADAFFVANRLPNLFRRLFGEGAFSAAFVPAFSGLLATEGRESAQHFAQQAAAVLVVWLIGLTVLAEIFMPTVVAGLAPGFRSDPEKFALAVQLCRITFPYMPLICLGALLSGDWTTVTATEERHLREASTLVAAYLAWHLERGLKSLGHVQR